MPVCDQGASAAQPKAKVPTAKQRKRTPTRAQLRALRFTPRATVSTEVFERLVARFSHEGGPDAVRAELQRVAPMTQTRRSLKALKFSSRDLGDAYSHAFIVLWTVVNGRPVVSEKSAIMASSWNGLVQSGDAAAADAWREQARDLAAERDLYGLDLTQVKLTSRGVARR